MLDYTTGEEKTQNYFLKGGFTMQNQIPRFLSIRAIAETGLLTEHTLRLMEKQGKLPCIYAGRKCLVNFDRLVQQLNSLGGEGDVAD